ncbi:hypothetical protein ULVI_01245 [Cochleicola gelatinilyticus]|uniref:DUF5683 domain-containing protein n=1 Tax=Cochleicola gelatinilyticus TaxID=1763537 RepID=A0A167K7P9_9FLAO|nr:hypothetical protein ULVI_01245 [Cochleicola gelatinilyticus]
MKNNLLYILLFLPIVFLSAQTSDTIPVTKTETIVVTKDSISNLEPYDPLAPSRAAFYSAVVPGLGQAYNKKYWKIPLIYAGMASGVYFYLRNDKDYNLFRDAYKRRLAGFNDDEFQGISDQRLIDAQKNAQKNKDVSIIVALAFYMVNIIDANVDAHLRQYNVSEDISLQPNFEVNPINTQANYGLSLTFRLK